MPRTTTIVLAAATLVSAAVATGCARQPSQGGTTTVTSGTSGPTGSGSTSGVRVTGTRSERSDAAMRLADEMCSRAAACNQVGDGARYRTEEACMADQGAQTPAQVSSWSCTPPSTQSSFEECLAAIRSERCESALPRADRLVACRSVAVCGQ